MITIAFLVAFCITTALVISIATGLPIAAWWVTSLVILTMSLAFFFALDATQRWLEGRRRRRHTEARMSPDSFFGSSGGIRVSEQDADSSPTEPLAGKDDAAGRKAA